MMTAYAAAVGFWAVILGGVGEPWVPAVGAELRRFDVERTTYGLAASPDGTRLLTLSRVETVIWTAEGKRVAGFVIGVWDEAEGIGFTPDGKEVFAAGGIIAHSRWDARSGRLFRREMTVEEQFFWHFIGLGYRWLAPRQRPGETDDALAQRRAQLGFAFEFAFMLMHPWYTTPLGVTPDGRRQVLGTAGSDIFVPAPLVMVRVWDGERGREVKRFTPARWPGELYNACRSLDRAEAIVHGAGEWVTNVIDTIFPPPLAPPAREDASGLIPIPTGNPGLRGSAWFDRVVRLLARCLPGYSLADQLAVNCLRSGEALGAPFAVSPDGRYLASCFGDASVSVWDLETGLLKRRLRGGWADALAFAPDGRSLVAAGRQGDERCVVVRWDLESGRRVWAAAAPHEEVRAVRFSADGRRMLVVGRFHGVSLWDAAAGKPLGRLGDVGPGGPSDAVFLGGRRAATIASEPGESAAVQVWALPE